MKKGPTDTTESEKTKQRREAIAVLREHARRQALRPTEAAITVTRNGVLHCKGNHLRDLCSNCRAALALAALAKIKPTLHRTSHTDLVTDEELDSYLASRGEGEQ